MTMLNASIPARAGSAKAPVRPIAHGQFRLLPVPLDRNPEWNARIADWARS